MRVRTFLISLSVIAALFLLKIIFIPSKKNIPGGQAGKGAVVSVDARIIRPVAFTEELQCTGTLLPNEEVTLKAETSGRITFIHINEGAPVQKGELLVKINDSELQAQAAKVKLQLRLAGQRLERNRKLLAMEGISKEEFDVLQTETETLKAELDVLLAQIEKTEIRAPFSGILGLRQVSTGALVSSQQMITTLQQTEPLKVEFTIPSGYLGRIHKGDTLTYTTGTNGITYNGRVYAIDPVADAGTRSVRVRAYSQPVSGSVMPGAFARVSVRMNTSQALLVPTQAVVPVLKGKQLFVVHGGKADTVSITTGVRSDSAIQVISGLTSGDTVITTGLLQLRPGNDIHLKSVQ